MSNGSDSRTGFWHSGVAAAFVTGIWLTIAAYVGAIQVVDALKQDVNDLKRRPTVVEVGSRTLKSTTEKGVSELSEMVLVPGWGDDHSVLLTTVVTGNTEKHYVPFLIRGQGGFRIIARDTTDDGDDVDVEVQYVVLNTNPSE